MVAKNGSTAESPPSTSVRPGDSPSPGQGLSPTKAFGGSQQIREMSNQELVNYLEGRRVEEDFITAIVQSGLSGSAYARMIGSQAELCPT